MTHKTDCTLPDELLEQIGIETILVAYSLGMNMPVYDITLLATMDNLVWRIQAVWRSAMAC